MKERIPTPVGIKINRWTILEDRNDRNTIRYVFAQCECGKCREVRLTAILKHISLSCGCLQVETIRKNPPRTTHGQSKKRMYKIWKGIHTRCDNKRSTSYPNYGAKGIKYDSNWKSFENFQSDMSAAYKKAAAKYGEKNISIDRRDNNGDYCRENCRWVSRSQQNANRSTARMIEFRGEISNLSEWGKRLNISVDVIYARLKLGWSVEKTLTTKVRRIRKRQDANT